MSSYGERKSSLMKWLSKLFKGGASRRRGATGGQQPGDENINLRAPTKSSVSISCLYKCFINEILLHGFYYSCILLT